MASLAQERSLGCWCISTVTMSPAEMEQVDSAGEGEALQRMSLEETSCTGELDRGRRAQVVPWSSPLIQSCWKVAWL
jgi:hypothetical protein